MHAFEHEWNAAWDASFADHYTKGTTAKRAEVWADAFGRSIELGRSERTAFNHALYEVLLISDVPRRHLRYVAGLIEDEEHAQILEAAIG